MVKGENTLEAGTPASFDVLTNEIRGLGLNMQLEKKRVPSIRQLLEPLLRLFRSPARVSEEPCQDPPQFRVPD